MKRIYALLMALGLILLLSLSASGANQSGFRILVDGETLDSPASYISQDGTAMVSLRAIAEALGCNVVWDPVTRTASVSSAALPEEAPQYSALVVLDPGHGGEANGAEYGGVMEKDLNLSIASQAAVLLEEAGVTVLMTRTDDRYVDLYDRTALANGQKADLFVSVHCNANVDHDDVTGIYTCAYSRDTNGWRLAQLLHQTMREAAGADDFGMEERPNLAVLRTSLVPAALVECGFMSTEEELARLVRPEYQAKLARGIADGILAYLAQ
ncbi:MAG: N-acetylmuramoyl-L-alanine amidase [Oscillospiraceae bacterium]|nr:N-acetylmuramoyl-L-alanine amidase [Oscillospiraceae bacterium]